VCTHDVHKSHTERSNHHGKIEEGEVIDPNDVHAETVRELETALRELGMLRDERARFRDALLEIAKDRLTGVEAEIVARRALSPGPMGST
jgi:hypothetical protein